MSINGNDSNNTLTGTLGDDVINAFGGVDNINATQGADVIDGGSGNDRLTIIMGDATRFGSFSGARTYTISSSSAVDSSGLLNSSLTSIERITLDLRHTGDFDDTINLSGFITAATNPVMVVTGNGNNHVTGSNYDDLITVGTGNNVVDAGGGSDTVSITFDNDVAATLLISGSGGTVQSSFNGVTFNTVTNAEFVALTPWDDDGTSSIDASALTGFTGQIMFRDTNGGDVFVGHNGADFFSNTYIFNSAGDSYTGNGGADIYDYTFAVDAMDGDVITDLDGDDLIDLTFNNPTNNGGGFLANHFIGNSAFTGVAGEYRYFASGGQTFLKVDTNGDGVADETLTIANGQFALGETTAGSNQLRIIGQSGTADGDFMIGTLGDGSLYAQAGNDTVAATGGMDFDDGGTGLDQLRFLLSNTDRFIAPWDSRTITIADGWVGASDGSINTYYSNFEGLYLSTVGTGDYGDTIDGSGATINLIVRAGAGNDTIAGGSGDDNITTGLGINTVDGGDGIDTVTAQFDNDPSATVYVTMVDGAVVTTINGIQTNFVSNAELVAVGGNNFNAGSVIDASGLTGFTGTFIFGDTNGTNIDIGSAGVDVFSNGTGGTTGADVYTGNGGADIYDYTYAIDAMNGDMVTDFDSDDTIDLRFNNLEAGGSPLLCNQFIGSASFSGSAGQYRTYVSGGQTFVEVDTDGDGAGDHNFIITNGEFELVETSPGSNILKMAGLFGTPGDDKLVGTAGDDKIYGEAGNDILNGLGGADLLDGGSGADTMTGGFGDDTYVVDDSGDKVVESSTSGGTDVVMSSVSYILGSNVENLTLTGTAAINGTGNGLNNVIAGNDGNNILSGGRGADSMAGGLGDDTYVVDDAGDTVTEESGGGIDTVKSSVSFTLSSEVENLSLTGSSAIDGTGNELANKIIGNDAANVLDGGSGADTMTGGFGDDTYVVDDIGDKVVESSTTGGTDLVRSSITYTLGANVENLTLTGSAAINGTGNSLNNVITGNDGNNILSGGRGADAMAGGLGDDTYIVDDAGDTVTENSAGGIDIVKASVSFVLSGNVEDLLLTGTLAIDGTGNGAANAITGNSAANTLDGGAGADTMTGGSGNDTYVVDNAGDVVVETSTGGIDLVKSSITYTLGANVENLTLTGTSAIDGTGNSAANTIIGNDGNNVLNGALGSDQLAGGLGNDTVKGGAGDDWLSGGLGIDTLTGGAGMDHFSFDSVIGAGNVDNITDFSAVDDMIELSQTVFSAAGAIGNLAANAFYAGTAAHTADDRIIYDRSTGNIYYDADGTGAGAQVLFAHVNAGITLTSADFHIFG